MERRRQTDGSRVKAWDRQRVVDQLSFVLGRRAVAECAVIAFKDVRALKAGSEPECQPTLHAPDVVMVKEIWGQTGDFSRAIPVQEAAQCHSNMTGIAVHCPPHEGLDVAHEPIIRGWLIARGFAGRRAFLVAFSHIGREVHAILRETGLWQLSSVVPCSSRLNSADECDPFISIQSHGQRYSVVWMEASRQVIHSLQVVVCQHGSIPRHRMIAIASHQGRQI